jgi:hypothetical protein
MEVKPLMDWSKIAAASVTVLAGHDINIGLDVATNALEHNFTHGCSWVILAAEAASWGMTVYDAHQAYKEEGSGGAAKSLAGDALLTVATGGAWKLVSKGGKLVWVAAKKAVANIKNGRSQIAAASRNAAKNQGKDSAKNVASHEKYKTELRKQEDIRGRITNEEKIFLHDPDTLSLLGFKGNNPNQED